MLTIANFRRRIILEYIPVLVCFTFYDFTVDCGVSCSAVVVEIT